MLPPNPHTPPPPDNDPYLPNPHRKPPGWTPDWKTGSDSRGPYSTGPNGGERWYKDTKNPKTHWPHYDSDRGNHYPFNRVKPRPGQKKLKPKQSRTDPWLDEHPKTGPSQSGGPGNKSNESSGDSGGGSSDASDAGSNTANSSSDDAGNMTSTDSGETEDPDIFDDPFDIMDF
jgi:hypothetical protein